MLLGIDKPSNFRSLSSNLQIIYWKKEDLHFIQIIYCKNRLY